MTEREFISSLLEIDSQHVSDKPHGWIQWKGTEVCIDLHCKCGYLGHFDGYFFFYYRCPKCQQVYSVGQNVILHPLTDKEASIANAHGEIKSCEFDPDFEQ